MSNYTNLEWNKRREMLSDIKRITTEELDTNHHFSITEHSTEVAYLGWEAGIRFGRETADIWEHQRGPRSAR